MIFKIRSSAKFSSDGKFSVGTATWTNNGHSPPHPRTKLLNHIWRLKLTCKIKLFA